MIHLAPGPDRGPTQRDVFLPIIGGARPDLPPPDPALVFYGLLAGDPRQERPLLAPCTALVTAAQWRALGLASGDPFAHCDAAGVCANEFARQAGCRLPASYASKGNNIESLVAGTDNVQIAFDALANSPSHSDHLFGRGDFFRAQTAVGIALAMGGEFGFYWVIHIARCEAA